MRLAGAMRKYGRGSYDLNKKMMAARNGMRLRGDEMAPGDKYFIGINNELNANSYELRLREFVSSSYQLVVLSSNRAPGIE